MLGFTLQTIGGNFRPVRICSVNLFLIVILSWYSMSHSRGTFKSPLCKVALVQVPAPFCCGWHGISSHIVAAPGGAAVCGVALSYSPPFLLHSYSEKKRRLLLLSLKWVFGWVLPWFWTGIPWSSMPGLWEARCDEWAALWGTSRL